MKVLWIVNTIFPEVCVELGIEKPNVGGWMYALAKDIKTKKNVDLAIASIYDGKELKIINIEEYKYYLIPSSKKITQYSYEMEEYWKTVSNDFKPDVIHIHGTEYPHSLACINSLEDKNKVVVSIQGLVSIYERYYYSGINFSDIIKNISLKEVLKFNSIINQRNKFIKRGSFEKELISKVPNVIGRTEWDYVHTKVNNINAKYYFCNESLRDPFYEFNWDINNIERNKIFLSQAGYPIKGLHIVLEACNILKKMNYNIKISIAGNNIMKNTTIKEKIKVGGYSRYLFKLIKKYNMENSIEWLGNIDACEMAKHMKDSHLFLCPSSIENSPNSLGEAQLIGVPCIASYVGGVPDMVNDGEDALLYRFEEYEMLAYKIKKILDSDNLACELSKNSKLISKKRHDREKNLDQIIKIYEEIINKCI